jgi:hypothetical protein
MRGSPQRLDFYVTDRLSEMGIPHLFPAKMKKADIPHDTHAKGPCFCMSSVVMRRVLGVLKPLTYAPLPADVSDTEEFFEDRYGPNPKWGDPASAMDEVVGGHETHSMSKENLKDIIARCAQMPAILPYCPTPPRGLVVILTPEQRMESMVDASLMMMAKKKPQLHSLCVAGVCYRDGIPYMACAQTWPGSQVLLVPFISSEQFYVEFRKRGLSHRTFSQLIDLNVIYFSVPRDRGPIFPLPLRAPFTFGSAACLPPRRMWIPTGP